MYQKVSGACSMFTKLFLYMISIFAILGILGFIWYMLSLGWQGVIMGLISVITVGFIFENL